MVPTWGLAPFNMAHLPSSLRSWPSSFVDVVLDQKYILLIGAIPFGVALALFRGPSAAPVIEAPPIEVIQSLPFGERWFPAYTLPVPVKVERIVAAPTPKLEPVVTEPPVKVERRIKRNICTRHGMRKVQIGKRWRCKR